MPDDRFQMEADCAHLLNYCLHGRVQALFRSAHTDFAKPIPARSAEARELASLIGTISSQTLQYSRERDPRPVGTHILHQRSSRRFIMERSIARLCGGTPFSDTPAALG
jgi:hypothetical protein